MVSDPQLVQAAIDAASLSARRFAVEVLDVDERTVRYWLADQRAVPGTVRVVCRAIIDRPTLAIELIAAHEALVRG
jgi:hypothetical protein